MQGFNYKKATQALNLFSVKAGGKLNKMKAIKLVWLADRLHLRMYGRLITNDVYFALPHGPVASTTKNIVYHDINNLTSLESVYAEIYLKDVAKYVYRSIEEVDNKVFSKTDLDVLNSVWSAYGHLEKFEIRDLSHKFPEWKKHEAALTAQIASRFEMNMLDFFNDGPDDAPLFNQDEEFKQMSKDIYLENKTISSLF